ncbi:hypothetical protein GCM10020254_84890 [Streptomyces goshikiensis]
MGGSGKATGRLRAAGRSVPLRPDAARQVAEYPAPADVRRPGWACGSTSEWGCEDALDELVGSKQGEKVSPCASASTRLR